MIPTSILTRRKRMAKQKTTLKRQIDWSELSSGTNYAQAKWERLVPKDKLVDGFEKLMSLREERLKREAGEPPESTM
jgi:hypothetical protein